MSAQESTSSSTENKLPSTRIEDILLERLKNEPQVAPQIGKPVLFAIFFLIFVIGTVIYFISAKPEKYLAEEQHKELKSQPTADSADINSKRIKFAPMTDSLLRVIAVNPDDDQAHLMLANVYYETEIWEKAKTEYEIFLKNNPDDINARLDYSFVLAQTTGDFKASLDQIKKALGYDAENVDALFKAGMMTIRANLDNKKKAVKEAIPYFNRALAAAKKQHNDKMAGQIEQVMAELDKLQEKKGE